MRGRCRAGDLYAYSFATGREFEVPNANSRSDEHWPTVWKSRIAFTRTYPKRHGRTRRFLYWRPFSGHGASRRLKRGPTRFGDALPAQLDMRRRRVTFTWRFEYGGQVRVDTTGGRERRLVRVAGSGAAANVFEAQGPTLAGGNVHWMLAVGSDAPIYSRFRRTDATGGKQARAGDPVTADANRQATTGFSRYRNQSWYVHAVAPDAYEIRVATDLDYQRAPLPELR